MFFFSQNQNKLKKIFAITGIAMILLPSVLFIRPQKAQGMFDIPVGAEIVFDPVDWFGEQLPTDIKNYISDPLAWELANLMIDMLTDEIVQWIRTGSWDEMPLFITNPEQFLLKYVDEASGLFLAAYLDPIVYDLLCNPFKVNIAIALRTQRRGWEFPYCKLSDVMNNMENWKSMMANFQSGITWRDWISISSSQGSSPYGLFLETNAEMQRRVALAGDKANTQAKMNLGFLGIDECTECICNAEEDPQGCDVENCRGSGTGTCGNWVTKSPGKWIQDQLSEQTTSSTRRLEIADEIDEILMAILERLFRELLYGTLLDFSPTSGDDDPADPAEVQNLTESISYYLGVEEDYLAAKQDVYNAYDDARFTYENAKECYQTYAESPCADPSTKRMIEQTILPDIEGKIANIEQNILPGLSGEIEDEGDVISDLEGLLVRLASPNLTSAEYYDILTDFMNLQGQGVLHTEGDTYKVLTEDLPIANQAKADADGQFNNCIALGDPCQIPAP